MSAIYRVKGSAQQKSKALHNTVQSILICIALMAKIGFKIHIHVKQNVNKNIIKNISLRAVGFKDIVYYNSFYKLC